MSLEKAIELLKKEYDKAKSLQFVKNPIAYALYQVWKTADCKSKKVRDDHETD